MRLSRMSKLALAACVLQLLITIGVPLMQFFLVFNMKLQYMHILITTGASAVIAASLGLAAAVSRGITLPALHVVAAILLAALMGSFNTQTYLDFDNRCNLAQSALVGCASCPCAATSTCLEKDLLTNAACTSCRALGTDLCARVRWQVLILPYTGLIEAVLLALPAFLSLLLLTQRSASGTTTVADSGGNDVKVMVSAWPRQGATEPDWPEATPADPASPQRAVSTKKQLLPQATEQQQWQQQQELGGSYTAVEAMQGGGGDGLTGSGAEYQGGGGYDYMSGQGASLGSTQASGTEAPKKKVPGLKKKLKSSVAAARGEAAIDGHF